MSIEIGFMNQKGEYYPLKFALENANPISKIWADKLKSFIKGDAKLETRWTGFALERRSNEVLCQKLENCIKHINDSWLNSEFGYVIELENVPRDYPTEVHNIVHHHFEILMGQVWNPSKWYRLMEERKDWELISWVRGLNDISHELEAVKIGKPFLCTTFWSEKGIQKDELPNEVEDWFRLDLEFGAIYLHYAQLGKTWQEVVWDDDDHIFEENITPFSLISGEFDLSFDSDGLTHQQHIKLLTPKLKQLGKDPSDKSLRLGRVKVAQLISGESENSILANLKYYDQIGYLKVDRTKREFPPYNDPY